MAATAYETNSMPRNDGIDRQVHSRQAPGICTGQLQFGLTVARNVTGSTDVKAAPKRLWCVRRPASLAGCGWQGTFNEGDVDQHDQLMDSSCPKCWKLVAIALYPTIAESRANWDKLSDVEKQWVDGLDAAKLKGVDQLPDLGGDEIRLLWDLRRVIRAIASP